MGVRAADLIYHFIVICRLFDVVVVSILLRMLMWISDDMNRWIWLCNLDFVMFEI